MAVYDDIVFPTDISFNSPGGPHFLTDVAQVPSGWEQRDIKRDWPLYEWDVGYGARTIDKIYDLYKLFLAARGQAHVFLFKYWLDYKSIHGNQNDATTNLDQTIGVATASQRVFQLIKTYTVGSGSYVKTIYKPKAGTLKVSRNGSEDSSNWSMDASTGVITRTSGLTEGDTIKAGFEYYHPTRFASDDFSPSFRVWEAGDAEVTLREVRLEP